MTLKEIKQTDWYKTRPDLIKQAIEILPPIQLYKLKTSGNQCHLISYEEPKSGKLKDVTCTIQKTGKGGVMAKMGLGELDTNSVFGVRLDDLEIWTDEPIEKSNIKTIVEKVFRNLPKKVRKGIKKELQQLKPKPHENKTRKQR